MLRLYKHTSVLRPTLLKLVQSLIDKMQISKFAYSHSLVNGNAVGKFLVFSMEIDLLSVTGDLPLQPYQIGTPPQNIVTIPYIGLNNVTVFEKFRPKRRFLRSQKNAALGALYIRLQQKLFLPSGADWGVLMVRSCTPNERAQSLDTYPNVRRRVSG